MHLALIRILYASYTQQKTKLSLTIKQKRNIYTDEIESQYNICLFLLDFLMKSFIYRKVPKARKSKKENKFWHFILQRRKKNQIEIVLQKFLVAARAKKKKGKLNRHENRFTYYIQLENRCDNMCVRVFSMLLFIGI